MISRSTSNMSIITFQPENVSPFSLIDALSQHVKCFTIADIKLDTNLKVKLSRNFTNIFQTLLPKDER